MRRLLAAFGLPVALLANLVAQTPPNVRVVAVTPEPALRLAAQQSLNVRVAYESDQPLRFQAAGYFEGQKRDRFAMNPSPAYAAGKGEAIVWLSGNPGARIDEIRVVVHDSKWKPLFEVPLPVQAEWHAGVSLAPEAAWARDLSNAQQQALHQAPQETAAPTGFFEKVWTALATLLVPVAFLSVPVYPIVQLIALIKLRGPARLLSALPLSFMLPIYAFCLYALSQGSNLWPLYAIFASPVALIITLAIVLVVRRRQKAQTA